MTIEARRLTVRHQKALASVSEDLPIRCHEKVVDLLALDSRQYARKPPSYKADLLDITGQ